MINYAHRGASAYAPENTIAAFDLALKMGANGIETDIRKTKDGHLVLFHDDTLQRITGTDATIEEMNLEHLLQLDFGGFKGKQHVNEKIVLLDEFLDRYCNEGIKLAIEIKGKHIELEVLAALRSRDMDQYTITSFSYDQLLHIRENDSSVKLGFLTDCFSVPVIERLLQDRINEICPKADHITKELCDIAHGYGLTIRAWGVVNSDLMVHCCLCGVDGMTVNFPDLLSAYQSSKVII